MKKIYRALCLILAFASVMSFSSCAIQFNRPSPADTSVGTADTEDTVQSPDDTTGHDYVIVENDFTKEVNAHLNSIGEADYEGSVIMIATPKESLINEDECGIVMAKTVKTRNSMVENRFNISVYSKNVDPDTMFTELSNSVRAGDYYADLLMIPQYYISQFAISGLLFNLNSLPFVNFDAGYNIESGVSAAMALSKGYAAAGWACFDPDCLSAVFFNRQLVADAGLESPYELVRQGKWTWDEFFVYTGAVEGLNEKRAEGSLEAVYSYGSQNAALYLADLVFISEGNSFISGGLGNEPFVSITYDSSLHAMGTAQTLYSDPHKDRNSMEAISTFASGGSVFLIDRLSTMKKISNSDAEWGIVPLPKASAEQENYRTLMSNEALFFAVPANCNSSETVSRILSAMNAASLGFMADAYVTDAMYYYLRDNDSVEMMEKICYSAYYDMAYTCEHYDTNIPNSTYFAVRNVYEWNHDMNFYLSRFEYSANYALRRFFS